MTLKWPSFSSARNFNRSAAAIIQMEDPSIVGGLECDNNSNQSDPFYWVVEVEVDLLT